MRFRGWIAAAAFIVGAASIAAIALATPSKGGSSATGPVPWSCKAVEKPVLDRSASARARPLKYRYLPWVDDIHAYGRSHRGAWAGLYYDHSPTGPDDPIFIHVLLAKDVDRHARAIRALSENPRAVIFSRAEATSQQLEKTARQIGREQFRDPRSPDFGVEPVFLSEDPSKNRLTIALREYEASAAEAMHDRYGSRVCVQTRDVEPPTFLHGP